MGEPRKNRQDDHMSILEFNALLDAEHKHTEASFPKLFEALGFRHWHNRENLEFWMVREARNELEKAYKRQNEIRELQETIRRELGKFNTGA